MMPLNGSFVKKSSAMPQKRKSVESLLRSNRRKSDSHLKQRVETKRAMDVYRVHVSLRRVEPRIWRRIELAGSTTLKQFYRILQIAMGWEDYHLHEFIIDGRRYGTSDPAYDEPGEVINETRVRLATVLTDPGAEILY